MSTSPTQLKLWPWLCAQENLWTVFNMFPHMYHTLTEVAHARVSQVVASA